MDFARIVSSFQNNRVQLATLAALAWLLNGLDLQPIEYELRASVAISQQRVTKLLTLAESHRSTREIRFVECVLANQDPLDSTELQIAKIRVRVPSYATLAQLETWLESHTRPCETNEACRRLKSTLVQTKWKLESIEHTIRVIEQDRARDAEQSLVQSADRKMIAVKLVGFQKQPVEVENQTCPVLASLNEKRQGLEHRVEQLSSDLKKEQIHSLGFLQFSGATKQYPVVQSIGSRRGTAFLVLSIAIWSTLSVISARRDSLLRIVCTVANSFIVSRKKSSSLLDLPYLGSVSILEPIENSHRVGRESWRRYRFSVESTVLASLFVWGTIVLLRLTLDTAWRQLFLAAPMAGLSHLLSGVP